MQKVIVLKMSYHWVINYNYLVIDPISNQAVIIDPAWQMEKIDQALANTQTSLSGILITHAHLDHINLAKPLATKYNCPIWISWKEEIAGSGLNSRQLMCIDESPLLVGQMQIQPIFTPGHTLGSICYLIADNLFTGDTLFMEGCGICPDIQAAYTLFASLENLKKQIKPQTLIFPGHAYLKPPGLEFSHLLRENIYLNFKNKDDFARFRLRKRQNISALFDFI